MHNLLPILVVYFIVAGVVMVSLLLVAVIRLRDQRHEGVLAKTSPHGAEPRLLRRAETTKYEPEPSLLTPGERSFFGVLRQALGPQYYICPKVRLADIIMPAHQPSRSGWQSAFNRIAAKHVDFAVCDPASLAVLGVVELDDRTHRRFERGFRDGGVDAVLSTAGLQVIRIPASGFYSQAASKRRCSIRSSSRRQQGRDCQFNFSRALTRENN